MKNNRQFESKILEEFERKKLEKKPFYLQVKAMPKSPKTEIVERLEDGTWKIRLAAPATDGKANAELIQFLKKSLKASEVTIISGQKDRLKLVKVETRL